MLKKIIFIIKNKLNNRTKISPAAYLKNIQNIQLGKNCNINSNCSLDASGKGNIILGDNVILNRYAYLNAYKGNISIQSGTEINNYSIINGMGGVEIGKDVLIGPNVQIISYQHNYSDPNIPIKYQGVKKDKIIIEDNVWIGASSIIMAGVTISKGTIVGANSVVNKDTKENEIVAGVPAKVIKQRV